MEATTHPASAFLGSWSRSPSIGFLGTEEESRLFYFFRQKTVPHLSGFFGGDFWERLLLQAALHEPSIRHIILALGSLHEKFEQNNGFMMQSYTNGSEDDFTSKNYSQAISILGKALSQVGQQAIDVCLICSILFACLEVSRFHIQASFRLIVGRLCKATTAPLSPTSTVA
jgi:hypothetical protein